MITYNVEIENENIDWKPDITYVLNCVYKILDYYLSNPNIYDSCCLNGYKYKSLSFDILFCDSYKTHKINKEYRGKDYPADIITFSLFADCEDEDRFISDFEINLGEVIISLDKICDSANEKNISKDTELIFMISHGIMHLLGYDHQTEDEFYFVVTSQQEALNSIGIKYDKI